MQLTKHESYHIYIGPLSFSLLSTINFKQLLFFPAASPPPSLTSSVCLLLLWPFLTFQSSPQSLSPTKHIFLQQQQQKHQMQPSNLESFIDSTTPVLPSRSLPKSEVMKLNRLWHPFEIEEVEFFTLSDVWNRFDEWSAYGAGVPVNIGEDEMIVQYYVPYLSAIQIFTSSSTLNYLREETDSETRDSFSDSFSDDSESDKLSRWDGCSSDEGVFDQDSLLHFNDRLGYLYFQYFERSTPYERVPLLDKICMFSQKYPGLMSLKSVDLSPASWMAVAWYPIYHIPMGRTIKDLSTCFLTYHTLSSSFQDANDADNEYLNDASKKNKEEVGIRLRAFGMATYKMQGDVWISGGNGKDQEKLVSHLNVAGCWLKQLNVQHHDFNYFMRCHHC